MVPDGITWQQPGERGAMRPAMGCSRTLPALLVALSSLGPGCLQRHEIEVAACWPECRDGGAGGPCADITCGEHGRCAVDGTGQAVCACDMGYTLSSPTQCTPAIAAPTRCDSTACPKGQVCDFDSAVCVAPPQSACGMPPAAGGGEGDFFATCLFDGTQGCRAGLACVPWARYLNPNTNAYDVAEGRCRIACDPCQPSCPKGSGCVLLPSGGGFCNAGPLREVGDFCFEHCKGSLTCSDGISTICRFPCRPNELATPNWPLIYSEYPSDDCPQGDMCVFDGETFIQGQRSPYYSCQPTSFKVAGDFCPYLVHCRAPASCEELGSPGLRLCVGPDCRNTPCPPSAGCYPPLFGGSDYQCIRYGLLGQQDPCIEDVNCRPGLVCETASHTCQPPP